MGTSTSSRGPGPDSPLVPPWADIDNHGPGPLPLPQRFREFRKSLGKFVASGNGNDLNSALGKYAKTATGGHAVGPRRFGSMARAGGALFDMMSSGSAARSDVPTHIDLSELNGLDTDVAIDKIIQILATEDGDADRVRVAMNEALSECLDGIEEFDFAHISDEILVQMMLAYVSRCVFGQVILDSNDAFSKADGFAETEAAENELLALVGAATDFHMRPLLAGNVRTLTSAQIEDAQLRAIKDIWEEWEGFTQ
jgi:hypothetical protein